MFSNGAGRRQMTTTHPAGWEGTRGGGGGSRDWLEGNTPSTVRLRPGHATLCQRALTLGNTHSCLVRLQPQHSNCIFQQSAVGNRLNEDTLTAHVLPAAATAAAATTVCEANTDTKANARRDLEAIQRLCCSCPSLCYTHSLSKPRPVPDCPEAEPRARSAVHACCTNCHHKELLHSPQWLGG